MHFRQRQDDAIDNAANGIQAGRQAVNRTLDRLADNASDWREEARPVVDRLASQASDIARQGADWLRDGSDRVRTTVGRTTDRTVGYVRDEPVRAALMVAAAGLLLVGLMRLVRRPRRY